LTGSADAIDLVDDLREKQAGKSVTKGL